MKHLLFCLVFVASLSTFGQNTNNATLDRLITKVADTVAGQAGNWQFAINERLLICITDEKNNRMRIISPITEFKNLDDTEIKNALIANFHTALDVKYAIADDILWSVFIHPLAELQEAQFLDAIQQVYNAAETFGTSYSSTHLVFPGSQKDAEERPKSVEPREHRG